MQATYNAQLQQYRGHTLLMILILAFMVGMYMTSTKLSQHAISSHPNGSASVRDCLNKTGPLQTWVNPVNGRQARVCQLGPTSFGLQIVEEHEGGWREVTSFIKSKMTRLDQVTNYLRNAGYIPAGE